MRMLIDIGKLGLVPLKIGTILPLISRRVAFLGSSSIELQNARPTGRIVNLETGHLQFAKKLNPRIEHINKPDSSDPLSRGFSGDNFGLAGASMIGIATRVPQILSRGYKNVVLYSGNDPTNSLYSAQGIFDYIIENIINPLLSGGVEKIIWMTVQPRGTTGGNGISADDPVYWNKRISLNTLMKSYSRTGVYVIDQTPALAIPGSSIEEAVSEYFSDGLHLSATGAAIAGRVIAPYYTQLFDSVISYDPSSSDNIAPNGVFSGNSGTAGLGSSGQIVNNVRVSSTSAANYSLECSITSRSGEQWQRVQGTPTLADRKTITVSMSNTPTSSTNTGISITGLEGKFVRGRAKLIITDRPDSLDFSVAPPGLRIEMKTATNGGVVETAWDYLPKFKNGDNDGILLLETPAFQIASGVTHLSMSLVFSTSSMTGSLFGFETTGWELRECPDPSNNI